ncbi:hypothetical protein CMI43_02275 [Candidatus Pacearchaeota archaeon]|nr:hypothetical protein [Candidatus Pacearchaeota archaeon]|tara:strand:- start:3195 stop:5555 length:2361 start_codon:yes stop_codon:yes gene_type:complete
MVTEEQKSMQGHLGPLIEAIPDLLTKIDIKEWQRSLDIIYDGRNSSVSFVGDFVKSLQTLPIQRMRYCLDELSKIREVKEDYHDGTVDLETVILDSIISGYNLSDKELSATHDVFLSMYQTPTGRCPNVMEYFDQVKDDLAQIPKNQRQEVLENILKLSKRRFPEEKGTTGNISSEKNKLITKYSRFVSSNAGLIRNKFTEWTKLALERTKTLSDFTQYMEDEHGYFKGDLESISGGLPLSQIHGRLLSYTRALTGGNIKIESAESNDLKCSFEGDTFFIPPTVNVGESERENFGVYKALASYQAASLMFGTYRVDTSSMEKELTKRFPGENLDSFFRSYEHSDFVRGLFDLVEFARLDSRLHDSFPGLQNDLDVYKSHIGSEESQNKNEANLALNSIKRHICGLKSRKKLDSQVVKQLSSIQASSTVNDTLSSVDTIYNYLNGRIDLSRPVDLELLIDIEPENIVLNSNEREAGYLIAAPSEETLNGKKFRYDEWDTNDGKYKEDFVQVVEAPFPNVSDNDYVRRVVTDNSIAIQNIRRQFELLRPEEFEVVRKQLSGDIDYDSAVRARAELTAGITPSEKLYTREYKNTRSVASLVLAESSGSLRRFVDIENPDLRILDVIKHSQIYFSEALDSVGDRYALATFSGETEKNVNFHFIKEFDSDYNLMVRNAIGSVKPLQQNRDGAGVRHATRVLSQQPERTKLLFYLMEGVPHDYEYKDEYAIEDTKRSLIEAKQRNCIPIVLAFGQGIDDRVRSLADHTVYREVSNPKSVPEMLPDLYRKIAF